MLNVRPWCVWLVLGWVASGLTEMGIKCWTAPTCRSLNLGISHQGNSVRELALLALPLSLYTGVKEFSAIGSDDNCRVLSLCS